MYEFAAVSTQTLGRARTKGNNFMAMPLFHLKVKLKIIRSHTHHFLTYTAQ